MRFLNRNFPASKAVQLGIYLDVPYNDIKAIRRENFCNAKLILAKVVNRWLNYGAAEKPWTKLAYALENCNYGDLAEKIRQNTK